MSTLLLVVHISVCLFLIIIVLLQHGKGADIGATFGGSSNTVFGTEGPLPLLNKITTSAAILFMVTSLLLAQLSGQDSIMKDAATSPPAVEQTQEGEPITTMPDMDLGDTKQSTPGESFPAETAH